MVYVPTKPRRGGQTPKPTTTVTEFIPQSPMPPEPAKITMIRICDNRLRMIRFWKIYGNFAHIDLLRADLKQQIRLRMIESPTSDHEWFNKLFELVNAISDAKLSSPDAFTAVYNHIGRPYPKRVQGK